MKIVSLVPSITETLAYLNLDDEVVGITKFCVHPQEWFKRKPRIGGTKNLNIEKIRQLAPTMVFASKEENIAGQVEELMKFTEVMVTDVQNFEDAINMIELIGEQTNRITEAKSLAKEIEARFETIEDTVPANAAYFIWNSPMMVAGCDTYIHAMMRMAGFSNVYDDVNRYPEVTEEDVRKSQAEVLLLSSEPFPFSEKHAIAFAKKFAGKKIQLVDGEMFSWYGSRMLYAADYFNQLHKSLQS